MLDSGPESEIDRRWMSQALDLARQGVGLASPNPTVGCVLVKDGKAIGQGFHEYERRDHAEIVALRESGDLARGATAYVTLEPCSHHGRTGPCADALIAAEVSRVVVATLDANPAVHGHGIERLRQAGTEVAVGVLQEPAQRLNYTFAKYIRTGLPFVTLKAAMTLDGRIAPSESARTPGAVSWITGAESRRHVQLLRHSADALITGIGTVLADDPLLTDRSGLPRRRPLLRVALDSELRLPLASKLVQSVNDDLMVVCANPLLQAAAPDSSDADQGASRRAKINALEAAGVRVEQIVPGLSGRLPRLTELLRQLGQEQIASVMIEAGSALNSSFLNEGLVDRLFLFYAPYFLGPEGHPLLDSAPIERLAVADVSLHRFGEDFAFEGLLNDPWRS